MTSTPNILPNNPPPPSPPPPEASILDVDCSRILEPGSVAYWNRASSRLTLPIVVVVIDPQRYQASLCPDLFRRGITTVARSANAHARSFCGVGRLSVQVRVYVHYTGSTFKPQIKVTGIRSIAPVQNGGHSTIYYGKIFNSWTTKPCHYIFIISRLWLTSHPRSTVVILDTGTPCTSREIYSEYADGETELATPLHTHCKLLHW